MIPSIQHKFLIGFLVIFAASYLVLNHFVARIVESGNEKIMTQDLLALKKNSNVYVKQAFLINHYDHDETYFREIARDMVDELRRVASNEVAAYSVDGQLLASSGVDPFAATGGEDLSNALNGKTSYTVRHSNAEATVSYSYPVVIEGNKVGIMRFSKDYTYLYERSERILSFIRYTTIAIFAAAFLFSYVLSRHITIPIARLTRATTEVADGHLDVRLRPTRRRDEVGQLTRNFGRMVGKIKLQIGKIESDRDRMAELYRHRKRFYDNVTHELKTPLTSILGYAELVRDVGPRDEELFAKGMKHIAEESQRLHSLVVELLEQSREADDRQDYGRTELGAIVRDVCEGMRFKAERYGLRIDCEARGAAVDGSADRLRQLAINLVDNAIKYGEASTAIVVRVREEAGDAVLSVSNRLDSAVGDGIAETSAAREPGSLGLGLGICRRIAADHGGSLETESSDGLATVVARIPLWSGSEGEEMGR
ncbi:sensor histidine kinase [Cohnella xylanilytica]|uniref:sensor histidine kinase n=1 Tax=Cohnella xylanilytica TaxID=557555 RepID=UPI001B12F71D|nr:HAMP domain-containing sensor histidine kinase [Cohnella xylanilytica]GIO10452.1 sensor histidine kinase [Cohnella xylanilytica]